MEFPDESKLSTVIFEFLVKEDIIERDLHPRPLILRRTRSGYWQKARGAWSWWLEDKSGWEVCGSSWTATECVKSIKEDTCVTYTSNYGLELIPFDKEPKELFDG